MRPPDNKAVTFRKKGVKMRASSERLINFIGSSRKTTFLQVALEASTQIQSGNEDFARLGQFYESAAHQATTASAEKTYEDIYGDYDWSEAAQDPDVKRSLDEVYGNTLGEAGQETGLTEKTLVEVYGVESSVPNIKSLDEQAKGMEASHTEAIAPQDEDTKGIRGIGDTDAPIDPYV